MSSVERECELIHFIKNQLSIILGFAELVLEERDGGAIRREDVVEIRDAARAALDRIGAIGPIPTDQYR
jgi:hypothetical protein